MAHMKRIGKLGGQHKIPRLCNDRRHADAILELLGEHRGGMQQDATPARDP